MNMRIFHVIGTGVFLSWLMKIFGYFCFYEHNVHIMFIMFIMYKCEYVVNMSYVIDVLEILHT